MKSLLITLSVLTLTTTTGNLNNILHRTLQKSNISTNAIASKTQQDTKYIDIYGKEITTSATDLYKIITEEITQIGFYQNCDKEIQVVRMPKTIKKVPNQLPKEITSLKNMFTGAIFFNQDLSSWDTSNIKNMSFTFNGATSFNGNITNWNVSHLTNMFTMFAYATSFNQDLSKWKVSHVKNFSLMFYFTKLFNQNIATWNVENATDMNFMFYFARSFNQDLSQWNVKKVIQHDNFSTNSGIDNPNKLPNFKTNLK